MSNKLLLAIASFVAMFTLAACGTNDTTNGDTTEPGTDVTNNNEEMDKELGENMDGDGQAEATNSTSSEVPEGVKEAENPKFAVGDKVTVNGAHFEGMEGSQGTIVGAYETTVYSVSYTSTTNDGYEENHKWVIREEVDGIDKETIDQGSEVIINVDREEGMLGATGVIDTVEDTTVYIVNFTTTDGQEMKNYKWLKESELSAAQ